MSVEIRRGTARFADRDAGRVTHHAFSFGSHYDAERIGFGPMVCHDEHVLGAGRGFEPHRHAGLDVVSYVVAGALEHRDGAGNVTLVPVGSIAHLATGSGVEHAEHGAPGTPTRFVQVWLSAPEAEADVAGEGTPRYIVTDTDRLDVGPATLTVVRLDEGETTYLPAAPLVHAYVASGALVRSSLADPLAAGDAFLMTAEPAHAVTAGVPTVLLVWTFPASS